MKTKQYNIILFIAILLMAQTLFAGNYNIVIMKNDGTVIREPVSDIDSVIFEPGTVTDIDGNVYQTVKIGDQWWMAENLRTTHYRDGTPIPKVTDNTTWRDLSSPAYCYYENDSSSYKETYGALYNWWAVNGDTNGDYFKDKEIAPDGWHVPTDEEWKELEMFLGMSQTEADQTDWRGTDEGKKLKSISGWDSGGNGTDEVGFAAFPGGYRYAGTGDFGNMGGNTYFWAAWDQDPNEFTSGVRWLAFDNDGIARFTNIDEEYGLSVRCVMDSVP